MQTPQKQVRSRDKYALCRCKVGLRCLVAVMYVYALSIVGLYVVHEIVWIANFSPAITRGTPSARRLGMQATSVQHDQI